MFSRGIASATDTDIILSASRIEDKTIQKATGKRKRTTSPTKVHCDQRVGIHVGNQSLQTAVQNAITNNTVNTKSVVGIHVEPEWIGSVYKPDPMVSPYVMECMNCEDPCEYENSRWNVCGKQRCRRQSIVRKHLEFGFPWDNHAIYGVLPPLSDWCKPAGSTMEMSSYQATLDFFFRDANEAKIHDANAENKGSRVSTECKHQRTEKHVFKYPMTVGGTAASSKHRGDQPIFIHLHGVHYTFICVIILKQFEALISLRHA